MRYLALIVLAGCASEASPLLEPDINGKADGIDLVRFRGTLVFGTPSDGVFTQDKQFDGYMLDVRADAQVKLDITHGGSSMSLDTAMFVYGPADVGGVFPDQHVAFDDNAGYGKLSRITTTLVEPGRYAVVIGTRDSKGRGKYRLVASCRSGACAPLAPVPLGGCPAPILTAMRACVAGNHEMYDPLVPRMNAAEACSDADLLAPIFDARCSGAPEAWCEPTFEEFYTRYAPACTRDVKNEILDGWCVFGVRYRDIEAQPSMTLLGETRLVATSTLTALERSQIVAAVHVSSHTDVTTAAQAFDRVDENQIFQRRWWDASARRAYTSYEYGAGDNSFGRIYEHGTTTRAADIFDGDIYPQTCTATYGAEIRDCSGAVDCRAGTRCEGFNEDLTRGSCVNTAGDTHPANGDPCSATTACPVDSGLVCTGLTLQPTGTCLPAWQRRGFVSEPQLAVPDNKPAGAIAHLYTYGLATVDVDVWVRLHVTHPRRSDLVVTLENPAGTIVPVFSSTTAGADLDLDLAVTGFSGDEQVNGLWKLRVVDKKSGSTGTIDRVELVIGSRWD